MLSNELSAPPFASTNNKLRLFVGYKGIISPNYDGEAAPGFYGKKVSAFLDPKPIQILGSEPYAAYSTAVFLPNFKKSKEQRLYQAYTRSKDNVAFIQSIVFDFDDKPAGTFDEVKRKLVAKGLTFFIANTQSHTGTTSVERFKVVMPLPPELWFGTEKGAKYLTYLLDPDNNKLEEEAAKDALRAVYKEHSIAQRKMSLAKDSRSMEFPDWENIKPRYELNPLSKWKAFFAEVAIELDIAELIDVSGKDPARLIAPFKVPGVAYLQHQMEWVRGPNSIKLDVSKLEDEDSEYQVPVITTTVIDVDMDIGLKEITGSVLRRDKDGTPTIETASNKVGIRIRGSGGSHSSSVSPYKLAEILQQGYKPQVDCGCPPGTHEKEDTIGYGIASLDERYLHIRCSGAHKQRHIAFNISPLAVDEIPTTSVQVRAGIFVDEQGRLLRYNKDKYYPDMLIEYKEVADLDLAAEFISEVYYDVDKEKFLLKSSIKEGASITFIKPEDVLSVLSAIRGRGPFMGDAEDKNIRSKDFNTALVHFMKEKADKIEKWAFDVKNSNTVGYRYEGTTLTSYLRFAELKPPYDEEPEYYEESAAHYKKYALPALDHLLDMLARSAYTGTGAGLRFALILAKGGHGKGIFTEGLSFCGASHTVKAMDIAALAGEGNNDKVGWDPKHLSRSYVVVIPDAKTPAVISQSFSLTDKVGIRAVYGKNLELRVNSYIVAAADKISLNDILAGAESQTLRRFYIPDTGSRHKSLVNTPRPSHIPAEYWKGNMNSSMGEYVRGVHHYIYKTLSGYIEKYDKEGVPADAIDMPELIDRDELSKIAEGHEAETSFKAMLDIYNIAVPSMEVYSIEEVDFVKTTKHIVSRSDIYTSYKRYLDRTRAMSKTENYAISMSKDAIGKVIKTADSTISIRGSKKHVASRLLLDAAIVDGIVKAIEGPHTIDKLLDILGGPITNIDKIQELLKKDSEHFKQLALKELQKLYDDEVDMEVYEKTFVYKISIYMGFYIASLDEEKIVDEVATTVSEDIWEDLI